MDLQVAVIERESFHAINDHHSSCYQHTTSLLAIYLTVPIFFGNLLIATYVFSYYDSPKHLAG